MGYTHYLEKPVHIENWDKIISDVKKVLKFVTSELKIDIVNGFGDADTTPILDEERICLNGSMKQRDSRWITEKKLGLVWPSSYPSMVVEPGGSLVGGSWCGGATVNQRIAPNGDGSYETLYIARNCDKSEETDPSFTFCKTGYRPYDIAVMCCYLLVKHHDPRVIVSTDGTIDEWRCAEAILRKECGIDMDIANALKYPELI